jgi:hypothetical protein
MGMPLMMEHADRSVAYKVAYQTTQWPTEHIDITHWHAFEHSSALRRVQDSTIRRRDPDFDGTTSRASPNHTTPIHICKHIETWRCANKNA